MTAIILKTPKMPWDSPESFCRRKHRIAGRACERHGWWSDLWFRRCTDWDAQVRREKEGRFWSHTLLQWHDSDWLINRRLLHGSQSALAGQTGTRSHRGWIQQRWGRGSCLATASSGRQQCCGSMFTAYSFSIEQSCFLALLAIVLIARSQTRRTRADIPPLWMDGLGLRLQDSLSRRSLLITAEV